LAVDSRVTFPADVLVRLTFAPSLAFGGAAVRGRTIQQGNKARITWDANVGRSEVESVELPEKLCLKIDAGPQTAELDGNVLTFRFRSATAAEADGLIATVHYILPILLNVGFHDPPVIQMTEGELNGVAFCWELQATASAFDVTTTERLQDWFALSWQRLNLVANPQNRRLLRALHYFHVATRLERAGHSSWEFLAEIVLNLSKVLVVLFPPTQPDEQPRDAVRHGLSRFGYDERTIERDFLPAMALRDTLDVAHVSLVALPTSSLRLIYAFTERAESSFRELLSTILKATDDDPTLLEPYENENEDVGGALSTVLARLDEHFGSDRTSGWRPIRGVNRRRA
jgi:hypothetical protein